MGLIQLPRMQTHGGMTPYNGCDTLSRYEHTERGATYTNLYGTLKGSITLMLSVQVNTTGMIGISVSGGELPSSGAGEGGGLYCNSQAWMSNIKRETWRSEMC